MFYRPLSVQDLPQAKHLWKTIFSDPESFVDWYFAMRFPPHEARGLFDHEKLLCMAQAVPYRLFLRNQWVPVFYIVGLATDPKQRNQGFATQLLQNILEEFFIQEFGITILMPAIPLFYRRRGWEYVYTLQKINLTHLGPEEPLGQIIPYDSLSFSQLDSLYHQAFQEAHGRLDRTEKNWRDLLNDYMMDGGCVDRYIDANGYTRGYILSQSDSDPIKIREMALDDPNLITDALRLVNRRYPDKSIEWQAWSGQSSLNIPLYSMEEPIAMARIVNLKRLLETVHYPDNASLDFRFSVYDPLLKSNCNTYRWRVQSGIGTLLPIPDHPVYPQITIGDLTTWVMGEPQSIPEEIERLLPKTQNYMNDLF